MPKRRFRLLHTRAPGDIVAMTGLVRDLKRTYGDEVLIETQTSCKSLWRYNPYVTTFAPDTPGVKELTLCYQRGIKGQKFEPVHFLSEFHRNFKNQTGIDVPITEPRPDLHLSDEERTVRPVSGRYWVFLSGGKSDFTIKVWHNDNWIKTVRLLQEYEIPLVQIGAVDEGHWHPQVPGVLDLVGRTSLRDVLRIIQHADGVICGVTFAMHAAAALEKPCVVIAGGREAWWWEAYVRQNRGLGCPEKLRVPHRYLHTIGLLDCTDHHGGCWKNKVVPLNKDPLLCKKPVMLPGQPVAACMHMITPEHVVEAVMSYYQDGSLPPIKAAEHIQLPPRADIPPIIPLPQRRFIDPFKETPALKSIDMPAPLPTPLTPTPSPLPRLEVPLEKGEPQKQTIRPGNDTIFDNPHVGGKFTIFVLTYGPDQWHRMHRKCLDTIIATVPAGRLDLRVGSNQLCATSVDYINELVKQGIVTKHYAHRTNDKKYPVMREMFWDDSLPIQTKWLLWFDDDSIADRNRMWAYLLAQKMITSHPAGAHLLGDIRIWELLPGQAATYKSRPWYKGRPFRDRRGQASPNGNKVLFCAGGFWAMTVEAMRACGVPDDALQHNGGDYTIGEQLWQSGFGMSSWNSQKQFVHTSSVPRRGLSETHFGVAAKKPAKSFIIT